MKDLTYKQKVYLRCLSILKTAKIYCISKKCMSKLTDLEQELRKLLK